MKPDISKTGNSQSVDVRDNKDNSTFSKNKFRFGERLVKCVAVLLTIPSFLFAERIVESSGLFSNINDAVLGVTTLLACTIFVRILVRKIRTIIILATIVGCIFLCYNSFFNDNPDAYSFVNAVSDYWNFVSIAKGE